jgi:hypothetical protein
MTDAVISAVRLAAAHDGDAELVVTLTYPNGGETQVPLDEFAARKLLAACHATEPADLEGASWIYVRDALAASSSRY